MSDDRLDALIRKVYCYKPDDELYTELNTNDVSQYDTARQFAEFHLEQLDQLRAVLRPAFEAARERESGKGLMNVYLNTSCKALLAAGEILGLTEQEAQP